MNIVHCIFSFNTGGAETMLIDIANEQVNSASVSVVIINDTYEHTLLDLFDRRVKIVRLNRNPLSRFPWFIFELNVVLFRLRPDVVHLHHLMIARLLVPVKGRRIFYTVHAMNIPSDYSWRVDKMFAVSDAVSSDMSRRAGCPVVTIPNGINTDMIEHRPADKAAGSFKLVQVARLDASKKGQDILIRALSILKKSGIDNITVDFIGTGSSLNELKALAEELEVASEIRFPGLQDRESIYKNLCGYDIMCHPARYEGFGLSVVEGLAAGVPVVVSDEGGPFEIIEKGKYGLSFTTGDASDLADKILFAMQHYEMMLQVADAARKYVNDKYSVRRMVADYLKEYQSV